jgi:phosphate-selective porin OprO/OprP
MTICAFDRLRAAADCRRQLFRGLALFSIVLIPATLIHAEDLPTELMVAESFGASATLALTRPRRAESEPVVSADGRESTSVAPATVQAAFQDPSEPLPPPSAPPLPGAEVTAAEATAPEINTPEITLEQRLADLEEKYNELSGSHEDLSAHVEHFSHPKFEAVTMTLNGRIQLDAWTFPASSPGVNGFETGDNDLSPQDRVGIRRLRFGAYGDIYETMQYRIDVEWADADRVEARDVFLGFKELPILQTVLIGNQKRPYSLDQWNSSNFNVFMERPYVAEAFNPGPRRLGVQSWSHTEDKSWNWQYGVFNEAEFRPSGFYTSDHWQAQVAGRLANTLWYDESSDGRGYAHWAISGTHADVDGDALTPNYANSGLSQAIFRSRPEARTVNPWVDTELIPEADNFNLVGLESVVNLGPTQFVAEYMSNWVNRTDANQLHYHGGYAYLSYFLTGEHMSWERDTGQLGPVSPFENFFLVDTCRDGVSGGWGAWQVAVRGSYGDLSDEDVQGGVGESVTLGLNWWWNQNARMQFNYIYGNIYDNDINAVNGINHGTYQIIGTRFAMFY